MSTMIDLHCHILPEIDDGAQSIEQSLAMANMAVAEGISVIAATHHFMDVSSIKEYLDLIVKRKTQFESLLRHSQIDLTIITGAEVYISPFLMSIERLKELCINGSNYMLFELPMGDIPQYTEEVIYQLQLMGITPIIAHPERNRRIIENPNILYRFIDLGVLGQLNTGSVTGMFGSRVQKCARILLEHDMVHILGSDGHSDGTRGPRMKKSVDIINNWIGQDKGRAMSYTIPNSIINNEIIELPTPRQYKRKFKLFSWFS